MCLVWFVCLVRLVYINGKAQKKIDNADLADGLEKLVRAQAKK